MLRVDEHGVTGRRWLRKRTIAWDAIRDYRLRIVTDATTRPGGFRAWQRSIALARSAYRGEDAPLELVFEDMQLTVIVVGDDVALVGGGFGLDGLQASNAVLPPLHRRLAGAAVAALDREPVARFGPLAISEREIRWRDRPPLAREQVATIELFTSSDVSVRVTRLHGSLPYCSARLDNIPNVGGVFEVARALGYTVRGNDLLAALGIVELARAAPSPHIL